MITKEKFRAGVGILPEQEDDLDWLLAAVVTLWEDATTRLWDLRTDFVDIVTKPRGNRPVALLLRLWPVTAITTVEVRRLSETDFTTLAADKYRLIGDRRLHRIDGSEWPEETRITFTGGVAEAAEDIQRALILQAKFTMSRMGEEKIAVKSQNFEGGSGVLEIQNFHPYFKMMVKKHKRKA